MILPKWFIYILTSPNYWKLLNRSEFLQDTVPELCGEQGARTFYMIFSFVFAGMVFFFTFFIML